MKQLLLSLLLFSTSLISYSAEKKLILLGGGGEPKGSSTIFDGQIGLLAKFANSKNSNWETSYKFNGGHENTESILKSYYQKSTEGGEFTEENYKKTIANLIKQIKDGRLKSGDQVLLMLATHGAMNRKGEKSHSVSFSHGQALDLRTLSGAKTVSLDSLQELIKLAHEKKVKLGILDFTCFSGNTIKLAAPSTCIISGSGETQVSLYEVRKPEATWPAHTFIAHFLQNMKEGSNLEDLFLNSRASTKLHDFPMISTPAGKEINDLIYKMLTPYLVAYSTEYKEKFDTSNLALSMCKESEQYNQMKRFINQVVSLSAYPEKVLETTALKKALFEYHAHQLAYAKAWSDAIGVGAEVKIILERDFPAQAELFAKEDGLAILMADYKKPLETFSNLMKIKGAENKDYKTYYEQMFMKDKIVKLIKARLSQKSLDRVKEFKEKFNSKVGFAKVKGLAGNVSVQARKLYDELYRTQKNKRPNPCKDFVL